MAVVARNCAVGTTSTFVTGAAFLDYIDRLLKTASHSFRCICSFQPAHPLTPDEMCHRQTGWKNRINDTRLKLIKIYQTLYILGGWQNPRLLGKIIPK